MRLEKEKRKSLNRSNELIVKTLENKKLLLLRWQLPACFCIQEFWS